MQKSDKQEILEAIHAFSGDVDKKIDSLDEKVGKLDKKIGKLDEKVGSLDEKVDNLNDEFLKLQTRVVTKDYLDEKMADLRGDLVVMMRKEDNKFQKLVEIMQNKKLLDDTEVEKILSMEPFAKLYT